MSLVIDEGSVDMADLWNNADRETGVLGENPVLVPLWPPQIACGLS